MRFNTFLSILMMGAATLANAQTEMPYQVLYQALAPGLEFQQYKHLSVRQSVHSKSTAVSPAQIQIDILSSKGTLRVPIQASGDMQFPMTEALRAENPIVRSNQPKGTLSLSATMTIKLPDGLEMPYQDLFEASGQAALALKKINPQAQDIQIPRIDFLFDPKVDAKIDLTSEHSEQTLLANARGVISVRIDPKLAQQQTKILFSHRAIVALPHIAP